ncbi:MULTISPECIES: glycoside hydrolase family 28 protein [Kribbella]|uniref:Polygalacturonase n=1 Tax=Kribbella pratensis TaxID=2512112 RepID=A0ABY2F5W4_9ACTN|nr:MULTISPECIES: glycoside hydrolase family 28 protein [Kribbella]TDW81850.1 polygalacturonase [Kribbella pratensis]TDW83330.1 polygalacturonase [Kribbella sp. VKM Ac-2566]
MDDLTRKNFLRLGGAAALAGTAASLGAGPAAAGGAGAGTGSGSAGSGTAAAQLGSSAGIDPGPGWGHVGHILSTVRPPRFRARDFSITTFGAVPDGTTLATGAIAKAIDACHQAGGGRVVVPAGTFLTGAIHLKSNVNLHVSDGATLLFSTDPAQYLPVVLTRFEGAECMNYSPLIYARNCENIAVTGNGTLDGGATWDNWWSWVTPSGPDAQALQQMAADGVPVADRVFGDGHHLRAAFIETQSCRNVLIEGVTILRSPFWEVHPVLSRNITVRGLHIDSRGPNNDGVNPESSQYVHIQDCTFNCGDDCIAIKSGRGADGLRVNVPSENILIEDCTLNIRYGAITIGSEMTGGVRNVFVRNCTVGSPNLYFGLYIKTNSVRGGFAENIYLRDLEISNLTKEVVSCNFYRSEGDVGPLTPRVRNVELRNVNVGHARNAFSIFGYPRSPIQDFRVIDCTYTSIDAASSIQDTELTFQNFHVNGQLITDPAQLT